jgi:autotransporter-associated beta strand protein
MDGLWGNPQNWSGDTLPAFDNQTDLVFLEADPGAALTTALGGPRTIRSLVFDEAADSSITIRTTTTVAGTTAANLTFDGGGAGALIKTEQGAEGRFIVGITNGNLVLADHLTVEHHGAAEMLVNRAITQSGGTFGITKTGNGTLRLGNATSSWTGGLHINQGTLLFVGSNLQGLGGAGGTVTLGGGTLRIEATGAMNNNNRSWATLADTTSTLIYDETTAENNTFTISGHALGYATALNGNLSIRNLSSAGGVDVINWAQVISGAGKIFFEGNNDLSANLGDRRLQIALDNPTWSGGLEVLKGAVNGTKRQAFGTGALVIGSVDGPDPAAIHFNVADIGTSVIANPIIVRGGGLRVLRNSANHGVSWTGGVSLQGTLTYEAASSSGEEIISGDLSGPGGFQKTGNSTLLLAGNNVHAGATAISQGVLRITGGNALPDLSPVILFGGTLDSQGTSETAGTLMVTDNSTIHLGSGDGTLAFADSRALAWAGTLKIEGTVKAQSLRFGNSPNALTSAQLRKISLPAALASLDADGYLVAAPIDVWTRDDQLDDDTVLVLNQSTLQLNGFHEVAGPLDLDDDSKIILSGGSFSFADSSIYPWSGRLEIVGELGAQSVRFGTSAAGLTASQLARIRHGGARVYLDGQGYLRRENQVTRHSYVGGPSDFGYSRMIEDFNWNQSPAPVLAGGLSGPVNMGDGSGRFSIPAGVTPQQIDFFNSPYNFNPKDHPYLRLGYRASFSAELEFFPSPGNPVNLNKTALENSPQFREAGGKFLRLAMTDPVTGTANPIDSNGLRLVLPQVDASAATLDMDYLMIDSFPTLGIDEFNRQTPDWVFGNLEAAAVTGGNHLTGKAGPAADETSLTKAVDFDNSGYNAVEIRVMRSHGSEGAMRLHWHARDIGWFTAEWQPESDGRYHSYMIDLSKCPEWTENHTTELKIGLFGGTAANSGKDFGIDFIRLRRLPELGMGIIHTEVNLGSMLRPRFESQWDYVLSKSRFFRSVAGQPENSTWRSRVAAGAHRNGMEIVIDGRQPWWYQAVDTDDDGVADYNHLVKDENGVFSIELTAERHFQFVLGIANHFDSMDPTSNARIFSLYPDNGLYVLMFPNGRNGLGGGFYEAVGGNLEQHDPSVLPAAQAMAVDCFVRMMRKLRQHPATRSIKVYGYFAVHAWEWDAMGREHSAHSSNPGNMREILDRLFLADAAEFPDGDSPLVGFGQDFPWQYYRRNNGRRKLGEYMDYVQSRGYRFGLTCNGRLETVSPLIRQSYEGQWRYMRDMILNGLRPDEVHAYEWTSNFTGDYETTLLTEHEDQDFTYTAAVRRVHDRMSYGLPPARPVLLSVVRQSGGIGIQWKPNEEYDITGYHVERSLAGGAWQRLTGTPVTINSFTDSSAVPPGSASYRVVAVDSSGFESLPGISGRIHTASSAQVLAADDFDDQSHGGWFTHITPPVIVADPDDDDDGVPAGTDHALQTTYQAASAGASWLRYFTPAGKPASLYPGDRLTIEWQAKQSAFHPTAINRLRFGLVDSKGERISQNEAFDSPVFTGYAGYKWDINNTTDDTFPYAHGVLTRRGANAGTRISSSTGVIEIPGLFDMIAMAPNEWTPVQRLSMRRENDGWFIETTLGGSISSSSTLPALTTSQQSKDPEAWTSFDGFYLQYSSDADPGSPDYLLDNFKVVLERAPGRVIPTDHAPDTTIHLAAEQYLDLIEGDAVIGGLSGEGEIDLAGTTLTIGGNNEDTTFAGLVRGTGRIVKTGTGTLTLTGSNPFSGEIHILEGGLRVEGSIASSTLVVGANGTLGGSGVIGGAVLVEQGGTLGLTGMLDGAAAVRDGGMLSFFIQTPADAHHPLEVTGSLTFSGSSTLEIRSDGGAAPGIYTMVSTTGGISGGAPSNVMLPQGWTADSPVISADGLSLEIHVRATDGLISEYDAWAIGFSGFSETGMELDPDRDGISNLLEFVLGGDPTRADNSEVLPRIDASGDDLLFTFTRSLASIEQEVSLTEFSRPFPLARVGMQGYRGGHEGTFALSVSQSGRIFLLSGEERSRGDGNPSADHQGQSPKLFRDQRRAFPRCQAEPGQGVTPEGWLALPASQFRLLNYRFGESGMGEVWVSFPPAPCWTTSTAGWPSSARRSSIRRVWKNSAACPSPATTGTWVEAEGEYASGMGAPPKPGFALAGVVASMRGEPHPHRENGRPQGRGPSRSRCSKTLQKACRWPIDPPYPPRPTPIMETTSDPIPAAEAGAPLAGQGKIFDVLSGFGLATILLLCWAC